MNRSLCVIVFSLLIRIRITLCSVNPKFEACAPKTCGNDQNISYPFYIVDHQDPSCGFPRFGLLCASDGFPMLNLSGYFYKVQEIFYNNHSVRLSNPTFSISNANTCLSPTQNLTLYGDRFSFAPNQKDLLLFFDCDLSSGMQQNRVGCSEENRTRSVLALDVDGEESTLRYGRNNCRGGVMRTVVEDEGRGIGEALRRGFVLNWTVSKCEQCKSSGGRCGFDMDAYSFRCFCPHGDRLLRCPPGINKSQVWKLALGLGIGMPGLLTIGVVLWWCKRNHDDADVKYRSRNENVDPYTEGSNVYFGIPVFSYTELEAATNHFDHTRELGDGGFGTVYYGKLQDGREVAVKRLYEQNYRRVDQFMNEIKILTRLRHKNLVFLYGCTSRHSRELLLVYEYVPNGTVAYHLHLHGDPKKPTVLPWPTRMKIAVQTASALAYLHSSDIIHRDVKTSNILLDEGFNVKVADFGLSRLFPDNVTHVSTAPQGTPGYVDPEYHQCYKLSSKSDVYSFGVVLMELISSMAAVDMSRDRDEINLSSLAVRKIQRSEVSEMVDPSLGFESDGEVKRMVVSVAQLAFQCLQSDKDMRPSMDEVLEVLVSIQSGRDQVHQDPPLPPPSPNWDEVGLLKDAKLPPRSPTSVAVKWQSRSTTPNVSG